MSRGPIAAAGSELAGHRDRTFDAFVIGRGCLLRTQKEVNPLANHRRHRNLPLSGDPLDVPRLFVGQLNLCANHLNSSMLSQYHNDNVPLPHVQGVLPASSQLGHQLKAQGDLRLITKPRSNIKNQTLPRADQFNLNIPRYVDTFEEEEEIDIDAVEGEMGKLLEGVRR